ncbi:DUF1294 domain-containing protein [Basfia succiniciproducens]|uniref:Uncharacterized membrane protein YsdA, DUF1294 family n=2 Tax=Basfia TaxID=697331 RepID=A0A1G5AHJ0_9PAST|nr:DUF1294 domain-containing protein [Basfia succiniciproducens]QIM68624.1 hypothetical protein A4G13_04105 [Basfia succiniciproducens]SCX77325.1 Uncharacterized membrane protein YsdA, DUF1294 family [Basfia succiniciproducens]
MVINVLVIYLAAVNIAAYFLMKIDKKRAKNKEWRIEEILFFSFCFMGGFIGIHLGMVHFRHKTKNWRFHAAVMLSAVLFIVILPVVFLIRINSH